MSQFFLELIRDFSYLSAICPASAENKKNGKMKIPPLSTTSVPGSVPTLSASEKLMKIISAKRNTLSLNAPKNWTTNNGANRVDRNN